MFTPMPEPDKKSRWTAPVIAAALIAPAAYLLGSAFYQGYMEAAGVEPDDFPISIQDTYVRAYQAVGYFLLSIGKIVAGALERLIHPPVVYWVAAILCLVIGGIYWLLKVFKKESHPLLKKLIDKIGIIASRLHWQNNDLTKATGIVGGILYMLLVIAFVLMIAAALWWLLFVGGYLKGKDVAAEQIKSFIEKGCHEDEKTKWNNCISVLDEKGNEMHEGLLIAMNGKDIAILKKDGSYLFSRQKGFLIRKKLR